MSVSSPDVIHVTDSVIAVATGDEGIHTCRPRYRVVCTKCSTVLHPNTTGPASWHRRHVCPVPPVEMTIKIIDTYGTLK